MATNERTPGMFTPQNKPGGNVRLNLSAQFGADTDSPEVFLETPGLFSPDQPDLWGANVPTSTRGYTCWENFIVTKRATFVSVVMISIWEVNVLSYKGHNVKSTKY